MHTVEAPNKKAGALTLDYMLFIGTRVPDIIVTKYQGEVIGGKYSPVSKATRKDVLLELIKVSKALQETIITSTTRKRNVDGLIKMLNK